MHRPQIFLAVGLIAAAASDAAWAAATAEAFACRNGERERRVELQHGDQPDRLPCEVVYWRDAQQPDNRQSIWQATNDFGFCIERTRDLVTRLQDGGWSCQKLAPEGLEVATIPALAPRAAVAAPQGDRALLGEALARDLQRLAGLTPAANARFEVESAELGDLDRDGDADAAVLLLYLTDQPETAQFLMAYRFDGDAFRPTAKIYVGGLGTEVQASGIERIENGAIELALQIRQPGDLECCPSGRRSAVYTLQDGALVALRPGS